MPKPKIIIAFMLDIQGQRPYDVGKESNKTKRGQNENSKRNQ